MEDLENTQNKTGEIMNPFSFLGAAPKIQSLHKLLCRGGYMESNLAIQIEVRQQFRSENTARW